MRNELKFIVNIPWKEKILDYEIETCRGGLPLEALQAILKRKDSRLRDWNLAIESVDGAISSLEKKRFSITRLKPDLNTFRAQSELFPWKEKILDYEIETNPPVFPRVLASRQLEKKRFSITRLKLPSSPLKHHYLFLAWKEKILDYEIETDHTGRNP